MRHGPLFWLKVRIVMLVVGFLLGLGSGLARLSTTNDVDNQMPIALLVDIVRQYHMALMVVICIGGALITMFIIGVQTINPWTHKQWTRPHMRSCFIDLRDPMHFFHCASQVVIATTVGWILSGVYSLDRMQDILLQASVPLAGALGAYVGVMICPYIWRSRYCAR